MSKNIDEELIDNYDNQEEFLENVKEKKSSIFRRIFFMLLLVFILTVIYARYIGTSGLVVKEYNVESKNLPKSFNGLKIVHFSDFHYGRTTNLNSLKNLVKQINISKPDIVVFTGDFVDKNTKIYDKEIENISNELLKLNSTYGNYYISGNHDIKFDKFEEMLNNSNFINLNDNYDIIFNKYNDSILLSGINYNSDLKFLEGLFSSELPTYKINIMHIPDTYTDISEYNYDLILAGHSHNGQITLPFYGAIYTPNGAKKYYKPYYRLSNTDMYISSGIGVSNYNFRLFNRPSFNLYRLTQNSD